MRYLTLMLLLTLCLGCVEKEEYTQALPENDFITGDFAGRAFELVQGSYLPGLATHPAAEETVGEAATPQQRFVVRRMDLERGYLLELDLPLTALTTDLPAEVTGRLSWMELYADSYPGCPHVDTSSAEVLPVDLQLTGWAEDALTGSYRSTDAARTGAGQFSLVIQR